MRQLAYAPALVGLDRNRFRPSDELLSLSLLVAAFAVIPRNSWRNEIGAQSARLRTARRAMYLNEFYKFHVNQWQPGAGPSSEEKMR